MFKLPVWRALVAITMGLAISNVWAVSSRYDSYPEHRALPLIELEAQKSVTALTIRAAAMTNLQFLDRLTMLTLMGWTYSMTASTTEIIDFPLGSDDSLMPGASSLARLSVPLVNALDPSMKANLLYVASNLDQVIVSHSADANDITGVAFNNLMDGVLAAVTPVFTLGSLLGASPDGVKATKSCTFVSKTGNSFACQNGYTNKYYVAKKLSGGGGTQCVRTATGCSMCTCPGYCYNTYTSGAICGPMPNSRSCSGF